MPTQPPPPCNFTHASTTAWTIPRRTIRVQEKTVSWRLKMWLFDRLRKYVVYRDSYDPNEDFVCGHCMKPVLRRYIYCSVACAEADEIEQLRSTAKELVEELKENGLRD